MILVIDDNREMAECVAQATDEECVICSNAIEAMGLIADGAVFDLIITEVLLTGPDGFTFLNELQSYADTARIPVVLMTTGTRLSGMDVSEYGVVGVLDKETMRPEEIRAYVRSYVKTERG